MDLFESSRFGGIGKTRDRWWKGGEGLQVKDLVFLFLLFFSPPPNQKREQCSGQTVSKPGSSQRGTHDDDDDVPSSSLLTLSLSPQPRGGLGNRFSLLIVATKGSSRLTCVI